MSENENPELPESHDLPEAPSEPRWKSTLNSSRQKLNAAFASIPTLLRRLRRKPEESTEETLPASAKPGFARGGLSSSVKGIELVTLAEWLSKSLQSRGYAFYGKLFTILACTFFLGDVLAMIAGGYIPEPPTPKNPRGAGNFKRGKTVEDYNPVIARNLFNRQGLIPGEENPGGPSDPGGAPVRTSLPFNLIGTLILRDEIRSIATIEDKSASQVYPVRINEEIPGKARIVQIEPNRVVFVNLSANRREFVDLPEDLAANNPRITLGAPRVQGKGGPNVEQVSPNQFTVSRAEVDKQLADLNTILTQARAVPNFENGVPSGYKLFQIVPGSIYDKLGLKNGDVIAGLGGQPVNDPGKAFEMLNQLKTQNHLELQVKRDGKVNTFNYDIN